MLTDTAAGTQLSANAAPARAKWPRRDWILLPLLALLTIFLLFGGSELTARKLFTRSKAGGATCLILDDATTGVRGKPNSRCWTTFLENRGATEYQFNSCGHRAGMECGPKPPGTFRIVLLGSSIPFGLRVSRDQTFAALLPAELSRKTGAKIQVYNEAMEWGTPRSMGLRFNDVLKAEPDLIFWPVTPWDIANASLDVPAPAAKPDLPAAETENPLFRSWHRVAATFEQKSLTVTLLKHFLYESQGQYVKHYLMQGEAAAFLKAEPDAPWRNNLQNFDRYAADIQRHAAAARIPMVVTVLPQRAQAAMISMGEWPAGFDPYALGDQVRAIVESHGGRYVDVLHGFRNIPNPERYFFAIDEHPTADGHAVFSHLLAKALTSGAVRALTPTGEAETASRITN